MLGKFLASTGLALFAISGCEDFGLIADPPGEVRVVYVDGVMNHCITEVATAAPSPARSPSEPAIAQSRE